MAPRIPKELVSLAEPCDSLKPHPKNPRRGNVDEIAMSLVRHGQYKPIVVNRKTRHVLAGNHTLAAAVSLGWTDIAVTWIDIPRKDESRILLADNRTSALGGYDDDLLAELLAPLLNADDIAGLGYTSAEIERILDSALDTGINGAGAAGRDPGPADAPTKPVTKFGDVWILGEHRLVCGDSTIPATHETLMAGETASMLWTDPPYGVSYVGGTKDALTIENDDLDPEALRAFLDEALRACMLEAGSSIYIAAPSGPLFAPFINVTINLGWIRQTLIWLKHSLVLGRSDYQYKHEMIIYGWTPGRAHDWRGGRKQSSVLEFDKPGANREHPTMKPVELIVRCIKNSSEPGALILDPFAGSGSTLIAAAETKRRWAGIELAPGYCDVICRRFQEATGIVPIREGGKAVSFIPKGAE